VTEPLIFCEHGLEDGTCKTCREKDEAAAVSVERIYRASKPRPIRSLAEDIESSQLKEERGFTLAEIALAAIFGVHAMRRRGKTPEQKKAEALMKFFLGGK
jgi:hypothetical protein